jgi:hypothetical protein
MCFVFPGRRCSAHVDPAAYNRCIRPALAHADGEKTSCSQNNGATVIMDMQARNPSAHGRPPCQRPWRNFREGFASPDLQKAAAVEEGAA